LKTVIYLESLCTIVEVKTIMNLIPILFFTCFIVIIITILYLSGKNILDVFLSKSSVLADKIIREKKNVKVDIFQINIKSWNFKFNKADLLFLVDGLILLGYLEFFGTKFYRSYIILTNDIEFYKTIYPGSIVHSPKSLNLNSVNNDVYIELEFKQLLTGTAEIILKGLSSEDKKLINLKAIGDILET